MKKQKCEMLIFLNLDFVSSAPCISLGETTENVEHPSKRGAENVFANMVPVRSLHSKSGVCQTGIHLILNLGTLLGPSLQKHFLHPFLRGTQHFQWFSPRLYGLVAFLRFCYYKMLFWAILFGPKRFFYASFSCTLV